MSIKIIGTEIEALALKPTITGRESIPTGGEGLYRITTEQVKDYILNYFSKQSINLSNVDNTSDEDKPLSKAVRDALDNVLNKNSDNIVTSVNSLTGNVVLDASSFGLGNVDNTKDIDKPLSNANISSLFLKMDKNIFNEFENVFVRFQNRVEAWLANLDELAYRTHLLSLSNEERVFQLEKDLEDLRDHVDSEIHRIHHSLSNTQVDLVLKLVSDNFDTNLYHSLYLESVIQALQSYTDNSIALVNLELVELRKADALLDLQIRTLEQNTSQALTDLRNSFSDLKLSVDQQYVGLQILIEEAKDYIDSQIASIPVIITQFKNETSLLLKNLKDEVAGIIVDLDKKVDNVSTSIDDKINTNNEFYVASIYKATKKDLEDAINVLGSEFDLSFENFHEAVSDVKKEAENAALAAENLAAIRMAELTGLIESQTSHNLLIINAKVDEAEQTLEDTKNQLNAEADAIKAQITQERVDRDNAIKTAVDAAVTDLEIQVNNIDLPAVQLLSDKIDALNAKIEDGSAFLSQEVIDHINSELDRLDTKLQADIQFLSNNITLEQTDRLERISKLEDGFTQEIIDRKAGNTALLSKIENYKVSNAQALANIQSGIEVTVDETIASSSKWTEIDTKFVGVNTSISSVTSKVDTLNTENLAQASQLETMSTTISNNDSTVKGLITTETNSRTTADSNMNSRIATIQSEFTTDLSTTKAAMNYLEETTVSANEALSLRINQNKTSIEGVDSKVDSEITTVNQTITTLEGSVATQLERITSDYKDSDTVVNAAILRESTARAEANQALVERIEAVRSSFASGINIVPFIYTDPVEATTLPTINGVVLPITIPSVDLSKFFYTKYYWNLSPKPTGLTTVQFRSNSSDYNVQLTGGVKHIVSVYLRHNLATNKVVTLSLNTSTGFTVEKQVTVTPSSDFIRYFVVLTSPVAPALAYLSIKFTGPTTDVLSISRIMVEQKEGEPSVWTSGAIGSTSSYIDKINTLNNGQVALGERFESLSTDFNTKDANLRSLVATESESRSTADETLGRRVDSVQSSFDNTVFGGQNFWEFKDTGDTDSGTKTVVLVNDNLQHQRITINSLTNSNLSINWSNLKVTGSPALPLDVPTSFSFDILPRFSKIRVFVYTWGLTNNTTDKLIEVIPNKWNRVNINNVIAKPDGSDSYTGMFFLRFLLSDNNIVEADLVGSVFEIKNIQLQQGTKATGYVPPYTTLQNEVVKTNAAITTEASTRASQNLATATRINGVTAEIVNSENRANSKILTEETARVEGDRILTTRIQTLESTTDQLSIGASNLIPFSYNFKSGSSNNAAITAIADANLKLKIVTTNAQASATTLSNFLSVDSTTTYALTNISNTGIVTVVMSFWIKRENPSLAFVAHPEMRLNATTPFVLPFFVRGSPTQPNAYQLSYKFTSTTEEGFTTIAPAIRIKGPELASPLLIDRWKLELGTIATDWSDFKEGIVEIDKRTQASISNIQKTVTDNNTALTNELRRNTSLISDLPNQGINLLPYQTTVPKDTLWYKTSESVGLVYNSTVSSFKGINITTNAAALSTVTLNSTDTPFNVNLEVARYLFSVEALSTTDKHPLSVDLLPVRGTPGAIIKGASVELATTLKQHTFLFSVPVRGKYDIVLNVNNALVANRLIHITKPMLEQQIGTNLKASAFKEGLVDSEFSLLPITSSESNIISQLKTTAADGVTTASKVDTLTANVEREGLKVQGQITTINQSITNTEGNTTTKINQLSSKFEKDLLRSSENLIVLKNITTTNNGTVVLGADRTTFIFGKVSATSHFNIPVDFSTLQVGTRLTYSFNARSNYVLKDILLTASANLKVVRVLVGDTEQTTVTNSKITFNSSLAVNKYHSITILFEVILANAGTVQLGNSFNGTDQTFNVDIQYPMLSTGGKGVGWRLSNADSEIYKVYTDAQITQYSQTVANQFQAVAETQTAMQTTIETNRNKAATDIATVTKSISDNDQAYAQQFTTLSSRFTTYKGNGNNLLSYETSVGEKLAMFTNSVGLEITSTEIVNANYSKTTFKASTARSSFTLRVNLDENFSTLPEVLFSLYLSNLVPINITVSGVLTTLASASVDNRLVGLPTATYVDLTIVTPTGANIAAGTNILSINRLMVEQSTSRIPSVWVAGSKGIGTVIESNSLELKESIADAKSTLNRRIDSMESNFNGRVTGGGNIWTITDNLVNTNTITGNLTALIVDKTIDYLTIKSNVAQTNAAYKIANTSVVPNIQVVPNTTYSLSFKVRSTVATTMDIEVINGTVTPFKPTTVNLTTNTQLLTYSIKFTGSSSFETSIKLIFPSLVLNSVIHISELMFQEGPGTQYTKAIPYLERSVVATKANIDDHKATYASDKESTATRLNQMSTEYKSSGGSVLVDNTTSNPTSWWSGEKPDLKDNFVTVTGAPSGYTAFTKTNSVADKVLDDIYNLTTVPSSIAYTVSVYIKRVVGSLGRCYITTGIRLNSSPTSAIIRSQNIDVTSQVPANGTWVNVKVTVPASGANIPQKYFGFRLNVEAATAGAASYIQGYLVTPVVTSANLDGTVATKANIDDLSKAVSDANGASASRMQKLESDMVEVDGKTDTKIATALTTYYTRTETDSAVTGKVSEYAASLVIGGTNLLLNSDFSGDVSSDKWDSNGGGYTKVNDPVYGNVLQTNLPSGLAHAWVKLENNVEYVYSALVKPSTDLYMNGNIPLHYWAGKDNVHQNKIYVLRASHGRIEAGKWTRISIVFKLVDDADSFRPFIFGLDGVLQIAWTKLERGNKATDWSPNDQEVQQSINANANAIQTVTAEVVRVNGKVVSTAESVSNLSSNVGLLQGSINEVRQTVTNNQESTNTLVTSLRSGMADADDVSMMMRSATVVFEDLNFRESYNGVGVYGNQGNGVLVSNFTDKLPDNPVESTRQLQFIHSGGSTTPGLGGFSQQAQSRANGVFLVKFVAKLPVGFSFDLAANAYGDGANGYFIGSSEGTGRFKTYYAVYRCGATGSFSTVGFVYVNGQHPTPENPLIWHLASSTVYDCLDNKVAPDSVVNGIAEAKSTASTAVNKAEATALIAQKLQTSLDNTNAKLSTDYYTYSKTDEAISKQITDLSATLDISVLPSKRDTTKANQWLLTHVVPRDAGWVSQGVKPDFSMLKTGIKNKRIYCADGNTSFSGSEYDNTVLYFRTIVYVDTDVEVNLGDFTGDDAHSIYINGVLNFNKSYYGSTANLRLALKTGLNTIDVICYNGGGSAGFFSSVLLSSLVVNMYAPESVEEQAAATANAVSSLTTTVSNIDGVVTSQARQVTTLESSKSAIENGEIAGNDEYIVDLRDPAYDRDLYYPVLLSGFSTEYRQTIRVMSTLNGLAIPPWSSHGGGFSLNAQFQMGGAGWGTIDPEVVTDNFSFSFTHGSISPLDEIGQVHASSQPFFYVRGGGYYRLSKPVSRSVQVCIPGGSLVGYHGDKLYPRPYQASTVPKSINQGLNQQNVKLRQTNEVVNGVKAVSTVTVDNNGVMSGYGLISELVNGQVTSSFGVNADTFFIGAPASNKKPFIVTSYPQDINGVSYPAGTWIDTALIANATIGTAHIADAAITNAKIKELDASKITTGTLDAGRIRVGGSTQFDSGFAPTDVLNDAKTYVDSNTGNLVNNPSVSGNASRWSSDTVSSQNFLGTAVPVLTLTSSDDLMVLCNSIEIDPAKAYEVSVWLKKNAAVGSSYLGLHSRNEAGSIIQVNSVNQEGETYLTDNFYHWYVSGASNPADWIKLVAYVMPAGTNPLDMKMIGNVSSNAFMLPNARKLQMRLLNYYNGGVTTTLWAANPKIVEVDPNAVIAAAKAQILADSKTQTFTTQPTTPYTSGDIYRNGASIYVCTTTRVSGSYVASDWILVGDVTANNTAANSNQLGGTAAATVLDNAAKGIAVYNDVMSDLKITPVEKTAINQEWNRIQKEYASLAAQATSLNVSTATLTAAYNGLSTTAPAMSTILASMGTTTTLTAAQRDVYKVQYTTYYTQSADMVKTINEKISSNAKADLDNLEIGGRNLIRHQYSSNKPTYTNVSYDKNNNEWTGNVANGADPTWGVGFNISAGNNIRVPYGRTYITSFEVFSPAELTWTHDVNCYPVSGSVWSGNDNDNDGQRKQSSRIIPANQWTKCWFSYENSSGGNVNKVDLYEGSNFGIINNTGNTLQIKYRNIKGELANKPSEWTPAPEDVDAAIESKAKTFTSQPTTPYTAGDLWKDGTAIRVSTVTRASGSYSAADWTLVGDVTSTNTAANSNQLGGKASATVFSDITGAKNAADAAASKASAAENQLTLWKYPNSTYIDGGKIYANSVTSNQISVANLSAISSNLGTIKVVEANIEDGAITTAKIGDLQVDTLKIKDRAVTVPITIEKTGISPFETQYQTDQYHTVNADNWFIASITGLSANSSVIIFISGVYNAYTVTAANHPSKTYAVSSTSLDLKVNGNLIRSVYSSGSGTTYSTSQYGSSQESLSVFMAETDSNGNINISFSSVHSGNVNVNRMTIRYGYSATNAIIHILELKK